MKIIELKEKKEKELRDMIGVLKEKGRDRRFQLAAGRIKNTREIRSTRKTIAQIQTIMREKKQ